MAHRVVEVNGHPAFVNMKHFCCVDVTDVAKLPTSTTKGTAENVSDIHNETCAIGSTCIVKTGEVYMLWPDDTWNAL